MNEKPNRIEDMKNEIAKIAKKLKIIGKERAYGHRVSVSVVNRASSPDTRGFGMVSVTVVSAKPV